jgi:hypothetical protein
MDSSLEELRRQLCSDDVELRAQAYITMAGHFGWFEFDQYPLRMKMHETYERYEALSDCECALCELLNRKTELAQADDLCDEDLEELGQINAKLKELGV